MWFFGIVAKGSRLARIAHLETGNDARRGPLLHDKA
jgi:hypothetical protein